MKLDVDLKCLREKVSSRLENLASSSSTFSSEVGLKSVVDLVAEESSTITEAGIIIKRSQQSKSAAVSAAVDVEEENNKVEPIVVESEGTTSEDPGNQPPANRCNFCRKRVGLTGFKCRCGETFCSIHRYSDKHNCAFDCKSAGQDAIAKANPIVKADKIEKI
ncbi:hypothetical protein IFM89_001354 [Coptis chinensis]|uniref:AN1-type domain-containing protein n=1 Tax=Coptis chinensis TaxID=261450 RepID=A0A835HAU1_9MAGN|nr:hypothetical protein IFM89_001354 [Coptis chinensis]